MVDAFLYLDSAISSKSLASVSLSGYSKEQHNCKATGYWKTNSVKYNFLLIAHEYLFVFRK